MYYEPEKGKMIRREDTGEIYRIHRTIDQNERYEYAQLKKGDSLTNIEKL